MSLKNNRLRGKLHQKKVAERLPNAIDIGILGDADVLTDNFVVECKSRVNLSIRKWYDELKSRKFAKGKIPLIVLHQKNSNYDSDLVVINIKHFLQILKGE